QSQSSAAPIEPWITFDNYDPGAASYFDEVFLPNGEPRPEARVLVQKINSLAPGELRRRQTAIERSLLRMGITFNVYGDAQGTERIWPFDIVPRIVSAVEWMQLDL